MKKMLVSLLAAGLLAVLLAGCGTQTPAAVPEPEPETPAETVEATEPEEPAAEEEPESEPEPAKPTVPYLGDVPIFIGSTVSEATAVLGTNYQREYEEGGAILVYDEGGLILALDGEYHNQTLTGSEKITYQIVAGSHTLGGNLSARSTVKQVTAYQLAQGAMIYPLHDDGNFDAYDSIVVDSSGKYLLEYQFSSVGSDAAADCVRIWENSYGFKTDWSDYTTTWTCMDHDLPKNVVMLYVQDVSANSITFSINWGDLWGMDQTTVSLKNSVGSFSDGYGVSGSIQISDGTIKLKVDESSTKYVDTGWFTFVVSSF